MSLNPATIRMAGQLAASAGIVAGLPAFIARKHGEAAGQAQPQTSGLKGTIGYGLLSPLVTPMAAIAYGQGHKAGREKAGAQALQQQSMLMQMQAPTMQPILPINY